VTLPQQPRPGANSYQHDADGARQRSDDRKVRAETAHESTLDGPVSGGIIPTGRCTAAGRALSFVRREISPHGRKENRMSESTYKLGADVREDTEAVAGVGWLTFAGMMLGLAGTFNFIDGILALANSKVFTAHAVYVFSDLRTWGWIVLLLGILQLVAAVAIFAGSELARWFGITAAGLNAVGQLLFVPAYPFWSIALFTMDILIIYALAVYAGAKLRQ
jgi:hypothetical protein